MHSQHSPEKQARLIMEAVAVLHARGYGRLKLLCYIKEGLGAWRHGLFVADTFPRHMRELSNKIGVGSLPGWPLATGQAAEEVADALIAKYPELMQSALGTDDAYVSWYKSMLAQYPKGILQMESSDEASIAGVQIFYPLDPVHGR